MDICYWDNKTSSVQYWWSEEGLAFDYSGEGYDYWLNRPEGGYSWITTVSSAGETQSEERNMRKLYEVFVVDPETEEIWYRFVVAKSESGAQHKALKELDLGGDYDDYDIHAIQIMTLRKEKEIQEVRVIKE